MASFNAKDNRSTGLPRDPEDSDRRSIATGLASPAMRAATVTSTTVPVEDLFQLLRGDQAAA